MGIYKDIPARPCQRLETALGGRLIYELNRDGEVTATFVWMENQIATLHPKIARARAVLVAAVDRINADSQRLANLCANANLSEVGCSSVLITLRNGAMQFRVLADRDPYRPTSKARLATLSTVVLQKAVHEVQQAILQQAQRKTLTLKS